MKKGVVITIIAIILFAIIILFVTLPKSNNSQNINNQNPSTENSQNQQNKATIKMTSNGFEPNTIEIKKGTTVVFENVDTENHWPASSIHPTHTVYPGSGISKCGTSEEDKIFDACSAISPGEKYEFTFNEIGTWNYHDHLRSIRTGTITVK